MVELVRTNKEPVHSSAILTPELQVTNGLVSYWPMLKGQGDTLFDREGSNNGTINGATWSDGALDFDGTDDYVGNISLGTNTEFKTLSLWAYYDWSAQSTYTGLFSDGYAGMRAVHGGNEKLNFYCDGGDYTTSSYSLPVNEWFLITVKWDGSNIYWYKNGQLIESSGFPSYPSSDNCRFDTTADGDWNIGFNDADNDYFNGTIDEVRIYDKTLSSTEIQTIYNRGRKIHNQRTLIPVNTDGLVGYWLMTQGSGGTAYDESKTGNDGTIEGASWTDTANGKALDFDGTDDYVKISDDSSLKPSGITFSAWVFLQSSDWRGIIGKDNSPRFQIWQNDLYMNEIPDQSSLSIHTNSNVITLNTWHHVVCTYNSSSYEAKLYVDNIEVSSETGTSELNNWNAADWTIGAPEQDMNFFNGTIDEVRIYNRALSAQEITNIYEKTRGLYGV